MTAPAGPVPAPGSDAARKAGCTCPVMQSAPNGVSRYRICGKWTHWIDFDCPLHGASADPLPDLHMRPRTDAAEGGDGHVD